MLLFLSKLAWPREQCSRSVMVLKTLKSASWPADRIAAPRAPVAQAGGRRLVTLPPSQLPPALGVDSEEVDRGGVPAVHALQLVTAAPGVHLWGDQERLASLDEGRPWEGGEELREGRGGRGGV